MLRNYLKLAFRNLLKSRFTSTINIGGLAIGFLSAFLIMVYVLKETSYDRFHSHADEIYRVLTIDEALGVTSNLVGITIPALASAMEEEIPEVSRSVRLSYQGRSLIDYNRIPLYSERLVYVENGIFDVFDMPLVSGNAETALTAPNTVVLTKTFAENLFGEEEPMGKTIRMGNAQNLEVVGVLSDRIEPSHMEFDVLVAMVPEEADTNFQQFLNSWGSIAMTEYIRVEPGSNQEDIEAQMETIIRNHDVGENFSVVLQPLEDVHLKSTDILFDGYNFNKGDASYVSTLSLVGFFVILIAAFNFMNLSTARSANRAREVGMRKVMGAIRQQLRFQFLIESVLVCLLALALAGLLLFAIGNYVRLDLPVNPAVYLFSDPIVVGAVLLAGLLIGMLAGLYPAFVLSGFAVLNVLKGNFKTGTSGVWLRKSLVVVQFTASVTMMMGTLVVYQQLDHMKSIDKGFEEDQIVTLSLQDQTLYDNAEELQNRLAQSPLIEGMAFSNSMPGRGFGRRGIVPQGYEGEDTWIIAYMAVDDKYFDLMQMQLADGRGFMENSEADANATMIINEAAAEAIGWEDPVGMKVQFGGTDRTVIGVVEDFHYANLRHRIEPMMLLYNQGSDNVLSLRVSPGNMTGALEEIKMAWAEINPNHPFEYQFFDEEFGQQYAGDQRFADLVITFTWLAVIIACLGLLGLSTFTAEQRIKEIGIRKVLGAEILQVVVMLSKEFTKPVLLACILAAPTAYYFLDQWLQGFAYRIEMPWLTLVLASALALIISQLTVSYHALRAAYANPVESLKYE